MDVSSVLCHVPVGDVSGMIAVQGALKFNGGGHINHSIFWNNLSPNGGGQPTGLPTSLFNSSIPCIGHVYIITGFKARTEVLVGLRASHFKASTEVLVSSKHFTKHLGLPVIINIYTYNYGNIS